MGVCPRNVTAGVMATVLVESLRDLSTANHMELEWEAGRCESILRRVKRSCRTYFAESMFLDSVQQCLCTDGTSL